MYFVPLLPIPVMSTRWLPDGPSCMVVTHPQGTMPGDEDLVSSEVAVIIPTLGVRSLDKTLASIVMQASEPIETIIVRDVKRQGASWARNEGARRAGKPFLFFCDDDVVLMKGALSALLHALKRNSHCAYAYGWYRQGPHVISRVPFDPKLLMRRNFVSTMALVRADQFAGFDEKMPRWQDWELWVRMLRQGKRGAFVDRHIFTTTFDKKGISGNRKALDEARIIMRKRYGIVR
jgi:glycosyltransferase involved in cell wall biosynthesis